MNELCLFIKDNFWTIFLLSSMIKYKSTKPLGLLIFLFFIPSSPFSWFIKGAVLLGVIISVVSMVNDSSNDKQDQ